MEKSKSFTWIFLRDTVTKFLLMLAFSGFFNNSLKVTKMSYALYAAVLLTILYMFIRPLLLFVSIVPIIMTFGIFIVVINALLILFVSYLLAPNFEVASFGSAMLLALFISILNALLNKDRTNITIKKF